MDIRRPDVEAVMRDLGIYLSHSSADSAFCTDLARDLRANSFTVFFDTHMEDDRHPTRSILREIREHPLAIFILSAAALHSLWMRTEYRVAHDIWRQDREFLVQAVQHLQRQDDPRAQEVLAHGTRRAILPVLMPDVNEEALVGDWLSIRAFRRVGPLLRDPYTVTEMLERTVEEALKWAFETVHGLRITRPPELDPGRGEATDSSDVTSAGASSPAVWCVVANVMREHAYGPGGAQRQRGTKHFQPGAKVYCFPALWGDGYEYIQVIGRHRATHRYVTMVMPSRWLTNWRVDLVYSPYVISALDGYWDGTAASKLLAHHIVDMCRARETTERNRRIN
jgi:hypothetical protein